MKRNIIQLAGKTSVISLPSAWVKKYNLKKSDELDIEERGNELLIKTENKNKIKEITVNIQSFNERTLRYTISALHKIGYDEIRLIGIKPAFKSVINDLVANLLLGFVISENTEKRIVLRNIASEDRNEFNSSLRRAFLVTLDLADTSLELIKNNQYEKLNELITLEKNNNQLSSFCLRLINKGFYKEPEKQLFITTIIWNLEKITDEYKKWLEGVIALERGRVANLSQISDALKFVFTDKLSYDAEILVWKKSTKKETKENLKLLIELLSKKFTPTLKNSASGSVQLWTKKNLELIVGEWVKDKGLNNGSVLWPMRVALSGQENSPGPFEIAEVLGREETLGRLAEAMKKIK